MQMTPRLGALVPHAMRSIARPPAVLLNGRTYSKTPKSEDMLADLIDQRTLAARTQSLHRYVMDGGKFNFRINGKTSFNNILYYRVLERAHAPLRGATLRFDAGVANNEHQNPQSVPSMPFQAAATAKTDSEEAQSEKANDSSESMETQELLALGSLSVEEFQQKYVTVEGNQLDFLTKTALGALLVLNTKVTDAKAKADAKAMLDVVLILYFRTIRNFGIKDIIPILLEDLLPRSAQFLDKTETNQKIMKDLYDIAGEVYFIYFMQKEYFPD